jgi:hypothetical protein
MKLLNALEFAGDCRFRLFDFSSSLSDFLRTLDDSFSNSAIFCAIDSRFDSNFGAAGFSSSGHCSQQNS